MSQKLVPAVFGNLSSNTAHGQSVIWLGVNREHKQASCILVHSISLPFRLILPLLEFAAGWLEADAAKVARAGRLLITGCLRLRCAV